MVEFLSEINWSPLWISLKTGMAATIFAFFLGVFCARKIMKLKPGARAVLDGILTMPLVLPPTVAGFCLLLLFSLKRPFGSFLLDNFDIKVVQTWTGCVIAASVIAFPLMYRNARAAFEQVDICLLYTSQLLFVYNLCLFGGVSGAGIFTAQYAGQKDHEGVRQTFRYKLWLVIALTIITILILMCSGENLIGMYLKGEGSAAALEATSRYGMQYLWIMFIGLPPFMISQAYSSTPVSYTHLDVYKRQAFASARFFSKKSRRMFSWIHSVIAFSTASVSGISAE